MSKNRKIISHFRLAKGFKMPKKHYFRITWRHEVFIEANNPVEAKQIWEGLNLGNLDKEVKKKNVTTACFVEQTCFEDGDTHEDIPSNPKCEECQLKNSDTCAGDYVNCSCFCDQNSIGFIQKAHKKRGS